jgi:hypothetical protein
VRPATDFNAIRLEGGLVTPELLRVVAEVKAERQSAADYDLPSDTRVIDEVRAHWDRLRRAWEQWKGKSWPQGRAPEGEAADSTGGATRDQWQLPLLRALGFHNLTANPGLEVNGRRFPIARVYHASELVRVPIHLVGAGIPLDKRTTGIAGAATDRPHAHVQAYLNEEPRALWGLVSDGLVLRLLRDTTSLARPPFIEFDLVRIFDGDDFPSFAVLWLLCHATRFTGERPSDCALELWSQKAAKEGTRALDGLRIGVEKAIEALGDGFLSHPDNKALADAVREGSLDKQELFQEVLRVVYRMIFILVAEERDALHAPSATDAARELYRSGYALGRVRDLSISGFRGTAHGDLWRSTSLVFERLAERGASELGLNALGSFLFSPSSTPHLVGAGTFADATASARHGLAPYRVELKNRDFITAMRALSVVVDPATKKERPVDFRSLGAEELGSVYEGLLELHLDSASWPSRFRLATSAGNERKTSGSYYTPDSLVQCLLDSALEPVVKEAAKGKKGVDAAEAILNLKVCDPAVGSGHFLIAAAHRLAKHVARARASDSEPTPDEHRTALREVIRRSMYGVDINPMAAELCRVALWMESMDPGKPLSFLESHIVVGNSLIGATPHLMSKGIPDDAFEVHDGDEKAVVSALKKRNKQERKDTKMGQGAFDFGVGSNSGNDLGSEFATLAIASDTNAIDVARLARRHRELLESESYAAERLKADAWCASFFWKKDSSSIGSRSITEATFRSIVEAPRSFPVGSAVRDEIERLRSKHKFFHAHLAFPDVFQMVVDAPARMSEELGWSGGFDCILGNPPYVDSETMSSVAPRERAFIAASSPVAEGNWDLYVPFCHFGISRIRIGGVAAMVTPIQILGADYVAALHRELLLRQILSCHDISDARLFEAADVSVAIVAACNRAPDADVVMIRYDKDFQPVRTVRVSQPSLAALPAGYLSAPLNTQRLEVLDWLAAEWRVERVASVGDGCTTAEAYAIRSLVEDHRVAGDEYVKLINTGTTDPFRHYWGIRPIKYLGFVGLCPAIDSASLFRIAPKRLQQARSRKVVVGGMGARIEAVVADSGVMCGKSAVQIIPRQGVCPFAIAALLNSDAMSVLYRGLFGTRGFGGGSMNIGPRQIEQLPVPDERYLVGATVAAGSRSVDDVVVCLSALCEAAQPIPAALSTAGQLLHNIAASMPQDSSICPPLVSLLDTLVFRAFEASRSVG